MRTISLLRRSHTLAAWTTVSSRYAQVQINVQCSRRDVGADRGERPAPVSTSYLLTTTRLAIGTGNIGVSD